MKALLLAGLTLSASALAWESVCYQYLDKSLEPSAYAGATAPACSPAGGPNTARQRWVGPLDEHRLLWETTRQWAGLPAAVSSAVTLRAFTGAAPVMVGDQSLPSLRPVPFEQVTRVQPRTFTPGELAQLPDFSYALWDWAMGHETCPLGDIGSNAEQCHDFATHMGPVNANHFLPLARDFYARYHALAVGRAAECRQMVQALGAAAARFDAFAKACEVEALALEAVAQHFMQDAFSSGHMWQRWGSPELVDFPGTDVENQRDRAVLVALVSGMVHGSRSVLQRLPAWTGLDVNDALCAPGDSVVYVRSDGVQVAGLGDDYLFALPTVPFEVHQNRLFSCAASGVLQVYEASGGIHGPVGPPPQEFMRVDPTGDACFGQRATNRAMSEGAAIQFKIAGIQVNLALDSRLVGWLVPKVARAGAVEVAVAQPLKDEFRYGLERWVSMARLWSKQKPEGTEVSEGALGKLLGASPNGAYAGRTPVASYEDPPLPWPGTPDTSGPGRERAEALARLFHRAHAREWCARTGSVELGALKEHAADVSLDAEGRAAACEACAELASRHLRIGTSASSYDAAQEPLCHYLAPSPAYVYQAPPGEPLQLARAWCGCP